MRISIAIIILCLLGMLLCFLLLFNIPKDQPRLKQSPDSLMLILKAGYLMGADRERLGYDVIDTWKEDSTLFYNHFLKP